MCITELGRTASSRTEILCQGFSFKGIANGTKKDCCDIRVCVTLELEHSKEWRCMLDTMFITHLKLVSRNVAVACWDCWLKMMLISEPGSRTTSHPPQSQFGYSDSPSNRTCYSKLSNNDEACCKHSLSQPDDEVSPFSFLHSPVKSTKARSDKVLCYPIVKYPYSYSSAGISISKQQQLDSFEARDFVDAILHSLTPEERESLMCQERQRLRTFEPGWPHETYLPSREMARAGFYFLSDADKVQCVFCRGVLHNWLPGDRPMEEHSRHFRNCKLVRGQPCGNIPYNTDREAVGRDLMTNIILTSEPSSTGSATTAESLGINTQKAAKPEYAAEASRIRTYGRFPTTCPVPAEKICEAGFYYTGFDDTVKCFWCEGTLEKWKRGEDPWVEHARYFPSCHFITVMKGEDFISEVSSGLRCSGPELALAVHQSRQPNTHYYPGMIKTCLSMGYQESDVVKVIKNRSNNPFPSIKELLQALHQMEDESGAMASGNENNRQPSNGSCAEGCSKVLLSEVDCKMCARSSDVKQVTHIGLPCGCLILCDDCAEKGVPVCCPKCLTSLAGLMRVFLA